VTTIAEPPVDTPGMAIDMNKIQVFMHKIMGDVSGGLVSFM